MSATFYTRWMAGGFTSRPLRDLLAKHEGWHVRVKVWLEWKKPGHGLHRYYRGVLLTALHEAMVDAGTEGENNAPIRIDEVHTILTEAFLLDAAWYEAGGRFVYNVPSTSEISRERFEQFVVSVEKWMIEFWDIRIDTDEYKGATDKPKAMRRHFYEQ